MSKGTHLTYYYLPQATKSHAVTRKFVLISRVETGTIKVRNRFCEFISHSFFALKNLKL